MHAFPLSRLTFLSPDVPPKTTKTFSFPMILISNSRLIPVLDFTSF